MPLDMFQWTGLTLLRQQQSEAALQRHTLAGPLVVGREARGVGRFGDLAVGNLFERVEAVAAGVEGVHQMHFGRIVESVVVVMGFFFSLAGCCLELTLGVEKFRLRKI